MNALFIFAPQCELGALPHPHLALLPQTHFLLSSVAECLSLAFHWQLALARTLFSSLRLSRGGVAVKGELSWGPHQIWTLGDLEPLSPVVRGMVGEGTSDSLGLGSLRASFASSHPLPFTPSLFYCFITSFRASVARDSDGLFSTFSRHQIPSLAVLSSLVTCKDVSFRSKQIIETCSPVAVFNFHQAHAPQYRGSQLLVPTATPSPKPIHPLPNHSFSIETCTKSQIIPNFWPTQEVALDFLLYHI